MTNVTIGNACYLLIFLSACLPSLAKYFYMSYRQIIGGLYPSYLAYKALKQNDGPEIIRLVMYFIVFQIFSTFEFYFDLFLSFWMPFYYESKLIFIFWLISPYGNGAKIIYENLISKKFEEHEQNIDKQLDNIQRYAIDSFWNLFKKCHVYFNHLLISALAKAQIAALQYVYNKNDRNINQLQILDSSMKMIYEKENTDITYIDDICDKDQTSMIEIMETDIDGDDDNNTTNKTTDDQNENFEITKPLRRVKKRQKRLMTIDDLTTQLIEINDQQQQQQKQQQQAGPVTRSKAANIRLKSI